MTHGIRTPGGVLGRIVGRTCADLATAGTVQAVAPRRDHTPDGARFRDALRTGGAWPALIAEVKPASPSKGALLSRADIAAYVEAVAPFAAALSVLVDVPHFGGGFDLLAEVRDRLGVSAPGLPILAKGFFVDERQIDAAAGSGADAVLLMASVLQPDRLRHLLEHARAAGLAALCEAHDEAEIAELLDAGAEVVGVNARNLSTLVIDAERQRRLLATLPASVVRVAESGLGDRSGVEAVQPLVDAVLIGSHLAASCARADAAARDMGFLPRAEVKACGIRGAADTLALAEYGHAAPDFLGINRALGTRRCVTPAVARAISTAAGRITPVLVVRDRPIDAVAAEAASTGVHWVQLHGSETPTDARTLCDAGLTVVKALTPDQLGDAELLAAYAEAGVARFLLDGPEPGAGSRWGAAEGSIGARIAGVRTWLAGGLHPGNVAAALGQAGCSGVDTASGVEEDGAFSVERALAFAAAARGGAR